MGLFEKKKNDQPRQPDNSGGTEFDRDVRELLDRDDIRSRQDICEAEYNKALGLLENMTQENIHRAYDIMGRLASEFEYTPAIMWMGDFAENALHDANQAVYWYKKASDLGDGRGSRCFADMLMTGKGVQRDPKLAMRYYFDAANKGVPEAAFVLGEFYRNTGDSENALKAYRQAVAGGYTLAQVRIDQMTKGEI